MTDADIFILQVLFWFAYIGQLAYVIGQLIDNMYKTKKWFLLDLIPAVPLRRLIYLFMENWKRLK